METHHVDFLAHETREVKTNKASNKKPGYIVYVLVLSSTRVSTVGPRLKEIYVEDPQGEEEALNAIGSR